MLQRISCLMVYSAAYGIGMRTVVYLANSSIILWFLVLISPLTNLFVVPFLPIHILLNIVFYVLDLNGLDFLSCAFTMATRFSMNYSAIGNGGNTVYQEQEKFSPQPLLHSVDD